MQQNEQPETGRKENNHPRAVTVTKTRRSYTARTKGSGPIVMPDKAPRVPLLTHNRR